MALPEARERHRTSHAHGVVAHETTAGPPPGIGTLVMNHANLPLRAQKKVVQQPTGAR